MAVAGQPTCPHRPGERAVPHALAVGPPNRQKARRGERGPDTGLGRARGKPAGARGERATGPRGALASGQVGREGGKNWLGRKGEKEREGEKAAAGPRASGFFSYFPIFLFSYFSL